MAYCVIELHTELALSILNGNWRDATKRKGIEQIIRFTA